MEIDAASPGGNVFAIMASVKRLLKDSGRAADWPDAKLRMFAGDYANVCAVAEEVTFGSIVVVNRGN